MTVRWSRKARDDLLQILRFIAKDDVSAALSVIDRIEAAVDRLGTHPRMGRPGRVHGTRELILSDIPYVIPYRISGELIQVIRVLHAARNWPQR